MPTPEARAAAIELIGLLAGEPISPDDDDIVPTAEALDRFAAQRGAEADSYDDRDAGNRMVDAFLKEHEGAQTGGGDAGERITVAHAREIYYAAIESHARSAGKVVFPPSRVSDDGKVVTSPAEHIIAAFAAALRSSHREGAEAMRDEAARACSERGAWAEAKIADDKDDLWANYSNACDDCAVIVRALPMPGKTDAG